ncbi:MAG: class II glutamine amidotransferase [Clostridiales Family XIII bacterium]|jgi:glutamine amidotransferase|nr:class II glutamine amidotransferase [Clostridiales Family XIII bacterium]
MCQLFAVTASEQIQINTELSTFIEGSHIHKHGWGSAVIDDSGHVHIKRETIPAYESAYLRHLLERPVMTKNAMYHIRYATVGSIDANNTHPITELDMTGRQWTMIHNGTMFNCDILNDYFHTQTGSTDTERMLLYIVDEMNKQHMHSHEPLDFEERFDLISQLLARLSNRNKVNVILSDSEYIYVHGNSIGGSKALGEIASKDYIYELAESGKQIFATIPLSEDSRWQPVPINTVRAYKDGELIKTAKPHDNEYIESEEDLRYLYSGFSDL